MCTSLVQQPGQDVQRVVVCRTTPEAIVVGRAAVEFAVGDVLELEPQVLPRHQVDLADPTAVVRTAGATSYDRPRRVENGVSCPAGDEWRYGERVAGTDVVHRVHAARA